MNPAGIPRPWILEGETVGLGRAADLGGPARVEREHVLLTRLGRAIGIGSERAVEQELDRGGDGREIEQILERRGGQDRRIEAVILRHHDRGGAAGPRRDRVVALARLEPDDARAARDRVVAYTAEDRELAAAVDDDRVVAVLALEAADRGVTAGAEGQRIIPVATLKKYRQAVQARRIEFVIA